MIHITNFFILGTLYNTAVNALGIYLIKTQVIYFGFLAPRFRGYNYNDL
jgi:hypothetical protein